tara:strand:- start:66 stop:473 length:408 start_codon:yes stop_codon:yes gene_type:complete
MSNILLVGSYISIFLIFLAFIFGMVELSDDYSGCKLLLSLNAFFYTIILILVERYSKYITIHSTSNNVTINEYTFRAIFHTWIGITLIGTSDSGQIISIIVILFGLSNLVYNIKKRTVAEENNPTTNHIPVPEDT